MGAVTYEGRVERGQIKLKDAPALPEGAHVYVVVTAPDVTPRAPWARELYELFAPAREEASSKREEEVNADIDTAIAAVRGPRALEALIEELNMIPDFRYPDNIRLGIAPIYTSFAEIHEGVIRLRRVLVERLYEKYPVERSEVT